MQNSSEGATNTSFGVPRYINGLERHIEQGMILAAIARCLTLNGTRVHEAEHAYTSYDRPHWRGNLRFQEIVAVHMRLLRDAALTSS